MVEKREFEVKSGKIKRLMSRLMATGASVGARSTNVHSSMTPYVSKYVDGVSVIDLTTRCRNRLALYKLVSMLMLRKQTIIIVANTSDHARLASSLFGKVNDNVYVLTERWNPGMFSNYNRYRRMIQVYKRTSEKNKSDTMKRQYNAKYKPIESFYTKRTLPRLVIFIDTVGMETAIAEVSAMGIPMAAVVNSDYNNQGLLTYIRPIGSSMAASALIITIIRRMMVVSNTKSKEVDDAKFKRQRNVYSAGKFNKNVPSMKSRIVSKYIEWKIRRNSVVSLRSKNI